MKLNWRKHGIGYLAIALVITMVGFAAFNSFGAKAESGTTDTANTVVVTSPFTEAIKEVKSSVVGVSNYQMVRYSTGGSWSWGFGYDRGESTTQEVEAATGSGVVIAEDTVLTN